MFPVTVSGYEVAGEVVDVGEDVESLNKGDAVIALSPDCTGAFSESFITNHKVT